MATNDVECHVDAVRKPKQQTTAVQPALVRRRYRGVGASAFGTLASGRTQLDTACANRSGAPGATKRGAEVPADHVVPTPGEIYVIQIRQVTHVIQIREVTPYLGLTMACTFPGVGTRRHPSSGRS